MYKTIVVFFVILVLSGLARLTGCGQAKVLSGADRAAVLAFSEAATDNLFAGLAANDYDVFSRDLDANIQARVPAIDFAVWKQELDQNLGNYLSRTVDRVTQSDEFSIVVYQAKFEKAEQVTVTMGFHASGSIAFLSFKSEIYSWSLGD
jgi:hypothetical protein